MSLKQKAREAVELVDPDFSVEMVGQSYDDWTARTYVEGLLEQQRQRRRKGYFYGPGY